MQVCPEAQILTLVTVCLLALVLVLWHDYLYIYLILSIVIASLIGIGTIWYAVKNKVWK